MTSSDRKVEVQGLTEEEKAKREARMQKFGVTGPPSSEEAQGARNKRKMRFSGAEEAMSRQVKR